MSTISVEDLLHLIVTERIKLVEDLWDSIANRPEALELPEAQRLEIDRRLAEHE